MIHSSPRVLGLCAAAILVTACLPARAQPVGTDFTFQGELRNSGAPVAAASDLQFRLYDSLTGGTQIGPQLAVTLTPSAGRFTVDLDFGAAFAGSSRYLEIDARTPAGGGAFTTLTPRQPLTPAPYAMFAPTAASAANATQLNGQPAGFYQNAANLTAGTIPSTRLSGAYTGALILSNAANSFTGSGAGLNLLNASNLSTGTLADGLLSTNIPRLNGTNTFSGPANAFFSAVGIGTSPGALLDVQGGGTNLPVLNVQGFNSAPVQVQAGNGQNEATGGTLTLAAGASGTTSGNTGIAGPNATITAGNGGSTFASGFFAGAGGSVLLQGGSGGSGAFSGGPGGNILLLPGAGGSGSGIHGSPGSVGINTSTPSYRLHVVDAPSNASSPTAIVQAALESPVSAGLALLSGATCSVQFASPNGSGSIFYNDLVPSGFEFKTGGATRLAITPAGSVGIGTIAPEAALHVASGSAGTVTANPNSVAVLERSATSYLSFLTPAANERGLVFGDPTNATDGAIIYNNPSDPHGLQLRTGGNNNRLVIDSAGSVGIGTTSPASLLHVISGSAGVSPNPNSLLTVERNTSTFISMLAPANQQFGILFGTPTSNSDGGIIYNPSSSRALQFRTGGNIAHMTLDSAGNLSVTGTLSKGGGSFKIDHPLDPENKYLYHSFVESPDMKNIYDGVVTTDGAGNACIDLPEWFGALNRDFRYQLTVVDPGMFALVRVTREVSDNHFCIASNVPDIKVSWQVTGIRQDAFANANRIPVEQDKPPQARGKYLHPEAWNKPAAAGEGASDQKPADR